MNGYFEYIAIRYTNNTYFIVEFFKKEVQPGFLRVQGAIYEIIAVLYISR